MNPQNLYRFAALHAFLLSTPMILFSLLGLETPLHSLVYAEESLKCMADDPTCTLMMRMAMGGVVLIAYCYWYISNDLSQTGLIWAGIIAKTCVFIGFTHFYIAGPGSLIMLSVGITDLVLAGVFFLELQRRSAA